MTNAKDDNNTCGWSVGSGTLVDIPRVVVSLFNPNYHVTLFLSATDARRFAEFLDESAEACDPLTGSSRTGDVEP